MNLSKLFELQRQLDEHIERKHPPKEGEDRLAKKILALQVELGELANEWRGFKFWSNDQKPRTEVPVKYYSGGPTEIENWLLEEYVDCLHFFLSIGLDLDINTNGSYFPSAGDDVLIQFAVINRYVAELWW